MTQDNVNEEELKNEATPTEEETQAGTEQNENIEAEQEEVKEKTVEEKLEEAEAQIEELKKQMLYKAAEFDNYRKRVMQEKAELIKNGGTKVITTILPILDDLDRAQQTMDKMEDVAACKEGVVLIIDKFLKLLKQEGLEKMEAVGKVFDTDYHEAIAMVPADEEKKGKVIDCVLDGYTLNDKVIRHAKVAVGE
jgi:molecular chaperone GrpE